MTFQTRQFESGVQYRRRYMKSTTVLLFAEVITLPQNGGTFIMDTDAGTLTFEQVIDVISEMLIPPSCEKFLLFRNIRVFLAKSFVKKLKIACRA